MADKKDNPTLKTVRAGAKPSKPGAPLRNRQGKRKELTLGEYVDGILGGDRVVLSQAITLIESSLPEHMELALEIIERCLPHTGNAIRVGITGVPGVGKSTFIETLGIYLTETEKRRVAVLAIDPRSERTKGSILGDKTRMTSLATDPNAFIRPSAAAASLGGVARNTRETILLCEAAGFNTIIVETVGVGQSETTVHSMVDFFLLLMLAGAGDELQGIKRGIMEMADAIAITKADGANATKAKLAQKEYQGAIRLFPPTGTGWTPRVLTCSAVENTGIREVWETVLEHNGSLSEKGFIAQMRREQGKKWMHEAIRLSLDERFYDDPNIKEALGEIEREVAQGHTSPFTGAKRLLDIYGNKP